MAIRTTAGEVRKLIKVSKSIPSLDPYIAMASSVVDEYCSPLAYSEATLKMIEQWLAAHYIALFDRRKSAERAGSVGASYETPTLGLGFKATVYGQQALVLAHLGGLSTLQSQLERGAEPVFVKHLSKASQPCP